MFLHRGVPFEIQHLINTFEIVESQIPGAGPCSGLWCLLCFRCYYAYYLVLHRRSTQRNLLALTRSQLRVFGTCHDFANV